MHGEIKTPNEGMPFGGRNDIIKVDLQVTWCDGVEQIQSVQNMIQ